MSFNLGLKALRRLCEGQDVLAYNRSKLSNKLFKGAEVEVFSWVDNHVSKFHALPQLPTLINQWPEVKEVDTPEPIAYYLELLENQYYHKVINDANLASQNTLKVDKNAHETAMLILQAAINNITEQKYRTRILDVPKDLGKLVSDFYHTKDSLTETSSFGWPHLDIGGGVLGGDVMSFVGRPAMGKAQPLSAKVLTPSGWTTMGALRVGDAVASVDGAPSVVTGVFPQGVRRVFTLTFQDGRTCDASDEHLWEVWYSGWEAPKVETTLQLISRLEKTRYKNRLSIRLFSGEYGAPLNEEFSPYLLGVFLGDGCLRATSPMLSSADPEILAVIGKELRTKGLDLSYRAQYDYGVVDLRHTHNRLTSWFKKLGVWGLKSEDKSIPALYLTADRATRLELLRGLMDTDGCAEKKGGITFSSSSSALTRQVQQLVWSLGGKATIKEKETTHLTHYRLNIVLDSRQEAFSLPRKLERVNSPRTTHINHRLMLCTIKETTATACQCISVSHPSKLYVTDNYVVTHNTFFMLYSAIYNWLRGVDILFVSMEIAPLPIANRIAAMYAHTNLTQLLGGHQGNGYADKLYKRFMTSLKQVENEKAKFYVVDGNLAANVEEIAVLASQLKCRAVYIDGAYLLRHKNTRLDRYTRAAENVELMKRYATELNYGTYASWQFNRGAVKDKKAGETGGLEDIAFSDAIGQISSVVLGLFQEDTVETLKQREIKVLKGRNGEIGTFHTHWDFIGMNFSQIMKDPQDGPPKQFTNV